MGKKRPEKKEESSNPESQDLSTLLDGFVNSFNDIDLKKVSSDSEDFAKAAADFKKRMDYFVAQIDTLCKYAGITDEDFKKFQKDPSKCETKEQEAFLRQMQELKAKGKAVQTQIEKEVKSRLEASGQEPTEDKNAKAKESTKKRKSMQHKKKWMPL